MFPLQSTVDQFWSIGAEFLPFIILGVVVGAIIGLYLRLRNG